MVQTKLSCWRISGAYVFSLAYIWEKQCCVWGSLLWDRKTIPDAARDLFYYMMLTFQSCQFDHCCSSIKLRKTLKQVGLQLACTCPFIAGVVNNVGHLCRPNQCLAISVCCNVNHLFCICFMTRVPICHKKTLQSHILEPAKYIRYDQKINDKYWLLAGYLESGFMTLPCDCINGCSPTFLWCVRSCCEAR